MMSDATPDPATGPPAAEAPSLRPAPFDALTLGALGRRARARQISGNALMGLSLGLAVFGAALLLWAGIVTGAPRVVLLLLAAALTPARLLVIRLSAVTLADGVSAATNSAVRRWLSHGEAAALLLAGGLNAYGSGRDFGLILGLVCAALVLLSGLRGPPRGGYPWGLYPTLLLGVTALAATAEPLWGWRGQSFLVGLTVIALVLTVQLLRPRPAAAPTPPEGGPSA